ncbi:phospholipase D-like domain-containing protein [Paracoccaceae bacterium GXU_MW_L88]
MYIDDFDVLLTAEEAYPAMERAVLEAETEVLAGFRIFDPRTKLHSKEGLAIGKTWEDIFRHLAKKGVKLDFAISDFDPILAFNLHRGTGESIKIFKDIAKETGGDISARAAMHPARVGRAMRLMFWPLVLRKSSKLVAEINDMPEDERKEVIETLPRVQHFADVQPDGTLKMKWRPPHLYPATHHQKLMVIDSKKLIIGGLDVDDRRWDRKTHNQSADQTWQDVSVFITGDIVGVAERHLRGFEEQTPEELGHPDFIRTLSREAEGPKAAFAISPVTLDNSAEEANLDLIRKAKRLLYIETQFLRHAPIADALAEAAEKNPELELIIVMPAAPEDAAFENHKGMSVRYGEYLQSKCVDKLLKAYGERLLIVSPARPVEENGKDDDDRSVLDDAPIIYVHSKVTISDDEAALVSSANLNGRSMKWDTEAGLAIRDPARAKELRKRLFEHLLPADADERFYNIETACEAWRELAKANYESEPDDRRGFIMPYDRKPAHRMGIIGFGIPPEMV